MTCGSNTVGVAAAGQGRVHQRVVGEVWCGCCWASDGVWVADKVQGECGGAGCGWAGEDVSVVSVA